MEAGEKGASTEETEGPKEECQSKDVEDLCPEDDEKMEDSPVLGLLKKQKGVKLETKEKEAKGNGRKIVPSETLIKKAVRKRSLYIKANAEYVTDLSILIILKSLYGNAHIFLSLPLMRYDWVLFTR